MKTHQRLLATLIPVLLTACGSGTETATTITATATSSQSRPSARAVVTAQSYHDVIQRFYLAYFGRPADVAGRDYWSLQYFQRDFPTSVSGFADAYANNAYIRTFVDFYGASKESSDLYAGDNGVFITAIYRNLFNREPDAVGRAFWLDKLDRKVMTRAAAALQIMRGAQGTDIDSIDRKAAVAGRFTTALDTDRKRAAYDGMAANASLRAILGTVGSSTDVDRVDLGTTLAAMLAQLGTPRQLLNFQYDPHWWYEFGALPADGGAGTQLLPSGGKLKLVTFLRDTANGAYPNSVSYWQNNRLLRQPLVSYGTAPTGVLVSSLTQAQVRANDGVTFEDDVDDAKSYRVFPCSGPDACTGDADGHLAVRMDMPGTTPALRVKQPLFATRTASGAISGFLIKDKQDVQRVDANFGNPRPAFTLTDAAVAPPHLARASRRVGNTFLFNHAGEAYLWDAERTTAGEPLKLTDQALALQFGDALLADNDTLYLTRQTPTSVSVERHVPATQSLQMVGQVAMEAAAPATLNLTAQYFVLGDAQKQAIWVLPRSGGNARRLYEAGSNLTRKMQVHVAGERIWFTTGNGVISINTDGSGAVEYPNALLTGCVYRPGVRVATDNDVCESMLLLTANVLRGHNAKTAVPDVTYGTLPDRLPVFGGEHSFHAITNVSRGRNGEGMLFTRYSTGTIPVPFNLENWHLVAGKPGLTRVPGL